VKKERDEIQNQIVEAEREEMHWERKLELEREAHEALEPGADDSILDAMRKEIHRMKLRYNELQKRQEKLMQEMESSVQKQELLDTKAQAQRNVWQQRLKSTKATAPRQCESAGAVVQGLTPQATDMKRSIKQMERESKASDARIQWLKGQREKLTHGVEAEGERAHEAEESRHNVEQRLAEQQRNDV
jgi:hypothetical protein